jgi:hypothetical protein
VVGGPTSSPQETGATGELITSGTFIAFYPSAQIAADAAPQVRHNARVHHGSITRHGAITVLYLPSAEAVRKQIERCVSG